MQLKCLTLNIWDGGKLLDAALQFITKTNADIIFLQEVYDGKDVKLESRFKTLTILKNKLEDYNIHYEPEFIDNRNVGQIPQGNTILAKYPIVHKGVIFFDKPLDKNYIEKPENFPNISRNLIHAVIETPIGEVDCFNFHGIWDLDGDNYSKPRENMGKVIIQAFKGKKYVILAGDTNAKPTNQAMKNIEEELTSVFGDSLATTFNLSRKDNPGYATAAVDMMFVSNNINILSRECPSVDVSDHLPLIATLGL